MVSHTDYCVFSSHFIFNNFKWITNSSFGMHVKVSLITVVRKHLIRPLKEKFANKSHGRPKPRNVYLTALHMHVSCLLNFSEAEIMLNNVVL